MKMMKSFVGAAAVLLAAGVNANAQTIAFNAIGSSAFYLEAAQAAASGTIGATCVWSQGSGIVKAIDSRFGNAPGTAENGSFFVAWTPVGGDCQTVNGSTQIYAYENTDSTVGNRCFFASPQCTVSLPATQVNQPGASKIPGITDTTLPAGIQIALDGKAYNAAATDIRPEDAKFATVRVLAPCGVPVAPGSQYLGLGYASSPGAHVGVPITGYNGGSFNVADFNLIGNDPITNNPLPGTYAVTPVGAVPIVVAVNPTLVGGFGSTQVNNITRLNLAGYLDGTLGSTSDLQLGTAAASGATIFIREPLSGTYNTMEYSVVNNQEIQSSQDVGLVSLNTFNAGQTGIPTFNCTNVNGTVAHNPVADSVKRKKGTSARNRVIGTGAMVAAIIATNDSLGYAFWSAANFSGASSGTLKYITVDGIDPLQQTYTGGLVPTSGNGLLGNVTFANVKNGGYPIWSRLRIASASPAPAGVTNLVNAAQNFVTPFQPDFVPNSQLSVFRSHFAPPTVNFSSTNVPANGTGVSCTGPASESGGDVGGLISTVNADSNFCGDTGNTAGNTGRRQ